MPSRHKHLSLSSSTLPEGDQAHLGRWRQEDARAFKPTRLAELGSFGPGERFCLKNKL